MALFPELAMILLKFLLVDIGRSRGGPGTKETETQGKLLLSHLLSPVTASQVPLEVASRSQLKFRPGAWTWCREVLNRDFADPLVRSAVVSGLSNRSPAYCLLRFLVSAFWSAVLLTVTQGSFLIQNTQARSGHHSQAVC